MAVSEARPASWITPVQKNRHWYIAIMSLAVVLTPMPKLRLRGLWRQISWARRVSGRNIDGFDREVVVCIGQSIDNVSHLLILRRTPGPMFRCNSVRIRAWRH